MIYSLEFLPKAHKDWLRLEKSVQDQLRRKLDQRLAGPRVPKDALHGLRDCYKIKLQADGIRLVYRVADKIVTVTVIAIDVVTTTKSTTPPAHALTTSIDLLADRS